MAANPQKALPAESAPNLNDFLAELHANPASALSLVTDESPLSAAEAQIADEALYAPKSLILEADASMSIGEARMRRRCGPTGDSFRV